MSDWKSICKTSSRDLRRVPMAIFQPPAICSEEVDQQFTGGFAGAIKNGSFFSIATELFFVAAS
jgi:hypothetical protein